MQRDCVLRIDCRGGLTEYKTRNQSLFEYKARAEVDITLRRFRRQYEQLSWFERRRIIGMMEAGWSARRIAHQLG
ncbi:hypothetical protein TNCV_3378781 [Trichonephila clavipes]|nr:hypothetical protein TNCV_3378781 [Trichonephila clavipes]